MRYCRAFLIILLWVAAPLYCLDKDAGTSGAQFLKISVGARPSSMGEAYAAMSGDAQSLYWNPAGLADVKNIDIAFQNNNSFVDISENFVSVALPSRHWDGVWGFGVTYLDAGSQVRTTENAAGALVSANAGTFSAHDLAVLVSYALRWRERLSIGITAKYIDQKLESENATAFAADLGLIYYPAKYDNLSLGLSVQNLGTSLRFINQKDDLPINIKAGLAYRFLNGKLIWLADLNQPNDNELRANTGLEWWALNAVALRAGYSQALTDSDNGLTLGCGFRAQSLTVDYAYVPFGDLGESHRISAGYQFGR